MGEKVIQVIDGKRLEHDAKTCCVTNIGLIAILKEGDQQRKILHTSGWLQMPHSISIITTPLSSIRFDMKEEL